MNLKNKNYIKICGYRKQMSEIEKESLYADLLAAYIYEDKSSLISLLLKDEITKFKKKANKMHKEGTILLQTLNEIKNKSTEEEKFPF